MDINPSQISQMMTLLDEHQEHMPEGTRLALCNKLLECKQEEEEKEEKIEYAIRLIYPTVIRNGCEIRDTFQMEIGLSQPITIVKSFTQTEFQAFKKHMQHRKYGKVYDEGSVSGQILEIKRALNNEIERWVVNLNDAQNEDNNPFPDIIIEDMMIVDYHPVI